MSDTCLFRCLRPRLFPASTSAGKPKSELSANVAEVSGACLSHCLRPYLLLANTLTKKSKSELSASVAEVSDTCLSRCLRPSGFPSLGGEPDRGNWASPSPHVDRRCALRLLQTSLTNFCLELVFSASSRKYSGFWCGDHYYLFDFLNLPNRSTTELVGALWRSLKA